MKREMFEIYDEVNGLISIGLSINNACKEAAVVGGYVNVVNGDAVQRTIRGLELLPYAEEYDTERAIEMSKYLSNADRNRFIKIMGERFFGTKKAEEELAKVVYVINTEKVDCRWAMEIINDYLDKGLEVYAAIDVLKTKIAEKRKK